MSLLRRFASLGRLQVVLGLFLIALVFVPNAWSAAPLDVASASDATSGAGTYTDISIDAQSGTSGQNPSGTASFTVGTVHVSGPVTCLSVTGPDQGAGTLQSPTTAVLNFEDSTFGVVTVELVDGVSAGPGVNGGLISAAPLDRAPSDCGPSSLSAGVEAFISNVNVYDAPLVPTSIGQCMNGGWQNFPQFKNEGDCVSFVETGK